MDLHLKDKTFLIAGGSKGLGFGAAKTLIKEGANVAIGSRNKENLEAAYQYLNNLAPGNVFAGELDVSKGESISKWIEDSVNHFGGIHGLVSNHGGPPYKGFEETEDADWYEAFELVLLSAVRMIKSALPYLKKQTSASIVTITSSSVKEPMKNMYFSNIMRSGVLSLVKTLSTDLAPAIRINNLIPGRFDTERIQYLENKQAENKNISLHELREQKLTTIPLARYGDADELGKAAAFLLSDAASYITGTSLVVDGGKMQSI